MLEQLEERIVLDASVAPAGDNNQDHSDNPEQENGDQGNAEGGSQDNPGNTNVDQSTDPLGDIYNQDIQVILISDALDDVEAISQAADEEALVIVYDAETDDLASIVAGLTEIVSSSGSEIEHIGIISHGSSGTLGLAVGELWTTSSLQSQPEVWG